MATLKRRSRQEMKIRIPFLYRTFIDRDQRAVASGAESKKPYGTLQIKSLDNLRDLEINHDVSDPIPPGNLIPHQ